MLEINSNCIRTVKKILNTDLIVVDDFLVKPKKVVDYLYSNKPKFLWKHEEEPSNNGKFFSDYRHTISGHDTYVYNNHISKILDKPNQQLFELYEVNSNFIRFTDHNFNDYKNNYWYPHRDFGYTAILYLNSDGCSGTNIYDSFNTDQYNGPEHYMPWRPKNKFKLLYNIESKFNRLIIFDGNLLHGMAVNDDRFFHRERINLVTWFGQQKISW